MSQQHILYYITNKMVEGKKFIVGLFVGVLLLIGGIYSVEMFTDKIVVSLPSDVCKDATLRVTKDDFTLKCGRYIAFQADTITEYYKTYGVDEWVRNNRFVGRNKKHITLELTDYGNYFDIIRKTRYRKGRQNIDDGVLFETYTFTKDQVKISYNYEVDNKALHRVSMRIKKQVGSYLDAFDPYGHTGVLSNNLLSYEGYGNLLIDPTITLSSPANFTTVYVEGDTIPLKGNCSLHPSNLTSMSLWWNAWNESFWQINETTPITDNTSTTYTKIIPHPVTSGFPGMFNWSIECCNGTEVSGINCTFSSSNWTVDPRYKPEVPTIFSPNSTNLNLLNGSGPEWGLYLFYPGIANGTEEQAIHINWTHHGVRDNGTGVIWTLSYYGTTNNTRYYNNLNYTPGNTTAQALWNVSNLRSDLYYVTVMACNEFNDSLCVNDTTDVPVDIFDYNLDISSGESKIRFSSMPTYDKRPALGQTDSRGIIAIDWLGNRAPDGKVNVSLNFTAADLECLTVYAYDTNNPGAATILSNDTYTTVLNYTDSDPDYIWLWASKSACGTTTTAFSIDADLFFGGNVSGGT